MCGTWGFDYYNRPDDLLTVCSGRDSMTVMTDRAFSFSYLGYTQEEPAEKKHDWELMRYPANILCVDYKMTGVGSQSCGPEILEKYNLSEKTIDFTVALTGNIKEKAI